MTSLKIPQIFLPVLPCLEFLAATHEAGCEADYWQGHDVRAEASLAEDKNWRIQSGMAGRSWFQRVQGQVSSS